MLSGSDKILENNNILEPISCNNLFTPEECKEIILNSEGSESQDATIGTKDQINSYVRKTKVKYLALNNNNMWIGKKIIPVAEQINNLRYKFNITRIKELQVLEYKGILLPDNPSG